MIDEGIKAKRINYLNGICITIYIEQVKSCVTIYNR